MQFWEGRSLFLNYTMFRCAKQVTERRWSNALVDTIYFRNISSCKRAMLSGKWALRGNCVIPGRPPPVATEFLLLSILKAFRIFRDAQQKTNSTTLLRLAPYVGTYLDLPHFNPSSVVLKLQCGVVNRKIVNWTDTTLYWINT